MVDTKVLAVVGATTAVAVGSLYILYSFNKKPRKNTAKKSGKGEVSLEDLLKIFSDIAARLDRVILEVKQMVFKTMDQLAMQGKSVSEEEIYAFMNQSVKKNMAQAEQAVYARFKTTEKAVKKAASKHKDDPTFKKLVAKMKASYAQTMKSKTTSKKVSEEEAIAILEGLITMMRAIISKAVDDLLEENPSLKKPIPGALIQPKIAPLQQKALDELSQKHGFKKEEFDGILSQHKNSPKIAACFQKLMLLPMEYGVSQ